MTHQVIFILGTGHCGSTLLDLILGSHTACFSLGEVHKIYKKNIPKTVCDLCEEDCPIWTNTFLYKLQNLYQPDLLNRIKAKLNPNHTAEVKFYRQIQQHVRKSVLIDSSKKAGWILRNGKQLAKSNNFTPVLIYLSRDGRAVVNSYYRKYPERGLDQIALNWKERIKKINSTYQQWDQGSKLHIRYKDLALQPENTINQITKLIGLPFEPEMMRFWEHEHHTIKGNAGTKSMLLKFQKQHLHKKWITDNKKGYYKNHKLGIKFDERWKNELNHEEMEIIDRIIYNFNKELIDG